MQHARPFRSVPFGLAVCAAACAAALAYAVAILWREPIDVADFRYIWLAGRLWGDGLSPYGANFVAVAGDHVANATLPMTQWVYPPHWYLPATAIASQGAATAFRLFMAAGLGAVVGGAMLVWRTARRTGQAPSREAGLLLLTFVLSSTSTIWLIRTGQPLLPALLGLCLIVHGLASGRRWELTVGIVLALLKPHIGLPFVAALVFMPRTWVPLVVAGGVTALLSLPALLIDPPAVILQAMSGSSYAVIRYNTPALMNGLAHALFVAGVPLSMSLSVILAMASSCVGVALHRTVPDYVRICAASTAFLVTGHGYDVAVVFLLLPFVRGPAMVVAFALIWRAENIATALHQVSANILTLATGIIFASVAADLVWRRRRQGAAVPSPAAMAGAA